MLFRSLSQTATAPHTAQHRRNSLDRSTASTPALKPAHRVHTVATAVSSCLSASCLSTPDAHGAKWVRATPANAPGSRLRQARCSACPHPRAGKPLPRMCLPAGKLQCGYGSCITQLQQYLIVAIRDSLTAMLPNYAISNTPAAPIPPPMHIVTRPNFPLFSER